MDKERSNKVGEEGDSSVRVTDVLFEIDVPVEETHARALAINSTIRNTLTDHLDRQQRLLRGGLGVGLLGVVGGVGALVIGGGAVLAIASLLGGVAVGGAVAYYAKSRDPGITVEAVEKGYWTGYRVPDSEGVHLYDATGATSAMKFDLERLRDRETVAGARDTLGSIDEFPVVMPRENNLEAELATALNDVRAQVDSAHEETVAMPTVSADSPEADAVTYFAERADEEGVDVPVSVPVADAETDVRSLTELEAMADNGDEEGDLLTVRETSHALASDLSGMQGMAIDHLNDHIGTIADAFGRFTYHFYCPDCLLDDVESRLSPSDPRAGEWHCETCRSQHETANVIPRHRIKDDVVNPVWDQLWIEKDDQRREIYENIEDQKTELQEREFDQRREEIRSTIDRIRDLRSRIRDLNTQAKAAKGKVNEISDLMDKYDRLHEDRKEQFQQDVEESFAKIDEQTARILEQTRNNEEERIEQAEQEAKEKADLLREEERQRDIEKFVAEQERADARAEAQMEQDTAIARAEMKQGEAIAHEEMEQNNRHHRKNSILKTRGKTTPGGRVGSRVDNAKMKIDHVVGASVREEN